MGPTQNPSPEGEGLYATRSPKAPPLQGRGWGGAGVAEEFADVAQRAGGVACGLLGWRPAEFWAATPAELVMAVRGLVGEPVAALDGAELAKLREAFPDG